MKYLIVLLIVAIFISVYVIVEIAGGTQFVHLHILYIPIILSGFLFSVRGGIGAGIAAGLLMSPFMPSIHSYDLSQPFFLWALRLVFFTLVGATAGIASSIFRDYLEELELKQITDFLTGLPNLSGLVQTFSKLINNTNQSCIIVVIELFQINDIELALGTEGTRTLLKELSEDLKKAVGKQGILGVLQPHQFAILVPEENNVSEILKNCGIFSQQSYQIKNIPLFIEMHFGISRYPSDDWDLDNLTRKALIAINAPTNHDERVSRFDKSTDDVSNHNLVILHQLKNAIDNKSLYLEYQPKVYLQTDKVLGFEALVRWDDHLLGQVSPEDFIPLAEKTLLIHPLTQWLIETSLNQMHEWDKKGLLVPISINFAMKNFYNPSIFATLTQLLDFYRIPQHFLEIEVTETSVVSSLSTIALALNQFREIGLKIVIDDFGTGQASQQYLLELPIDVIKIDKVFVQSINHNPAAAAIVKNAILLAHDLKVKIIAEGIETRKQYDLLKQWGCDGGQGYLIGRSMKGTDATQWLKDNLNKK
ncbi:MAG: GGDEF domain-containing phosphodiesterase [Alphaproteobacteria bacterium]|nr:GGDEF domain-containing phosphodiesterase [Alphaproteobacteria bacterium]